MHITAIDQAILKYRSFKDEQGNPQNQSQEVIFQLF